MLLRAIFYFLKWFQGKYGNIGQTNYAASKAGVDAFTKSASKELGKFRIRCNSIQPGKYYNDFYCGLVKKKINLKIDFA